MNITRSQVVNSFTKMFENCRYLEVGVAGGVTFHEVEAAHKVAVDPNFKFDIVKSRLERPNCVYYAVESNEFFAAFIGKSEKFDVIYLDGLHTSEQTLCDLHNALEHLTSDGVIIIDDVRPPNYAAGVARDLEEFRRLRSALSINSGAWMGDVFKLVYFIETFHQNLSYHMVSDNHGQLVVWREVRSSVPKRTIEEVGSTSFAAYTLDDEVKRLLPCDEIVRIYQGRGARLAGAVGSR